MIDTAITFHSISRFLVPGIFVLLLVLESLRPLRRLKRARGSRYVVNGALTGLGFLTVGRQFRNPQLGRGRRRHREPASRLVRVCAGIGAM